MTLVGFLRLKWLLMRLRRINFPVPVMWMRAFAPLCVLSFGICWFFYLLVRSFGFLVSSFWFLILSFWLLTGGFRFLVGPLRFLRRGQENHR